MPILVLDEGSVLLLKEDSYLIGSEGEPHKKIKPTKDSTLTRSELLELMRQEEEKERMQKRKLSMTDPGPNTTTTTINGTTSRAEKGTSSTRAPKNQPVIEPLYRLKLIVEATCSYLKFPYANFGRILDDEKLILKNMADGK